jgi:HPt (histidine-containing phosphotransfer) domain-containing protein
MSVATLPCTEELAFAEALDAMGGDGELLQEIVEIFLETGPEQFAELEASIAAQDLAAMQTVAHGLKGSAASIGALGFAAVARELEFLAKAGSGDSAAALLARMRAQFAELEEVCAGVDWEGLPRLDY